MADSKGWHGLEPPEDTMRCLPKCLCPRGLRKEALLVLGPGTCLDPFSLPAPVQNWVLGLAGPIVLGPALLPHPSSLFPVPCICHLHKADHSYEAQSTSCLQCKVREHTLGMYAIEVHNRSVLSGLWLRGPGWVRAQRVSQQTAEGLLWQDQADMGAPPRNQGWQKVCSPPQ